MQAAPLLPAAAAKRDACRSVVPVIVDVQKRHWQHLLVGKV